MVWVAVDGPYNEHLVRDVGALNLALAAFTLLAAASLARPLVQATLVAAVVAGTPHLVYHLRHADVYDTGLEAAVSLVGLVLVPAVALGLLGLLGIESRWGAARPGGGVGAR
jgi:hypothetical protein